MNTKKTKKGFTLVELLLYISIATALLGAISLLMVTMFEGRIRNSVTRTVDIEVGRAMRTMMHVIRNADSISTPSQSNTGSTLSLVVSNGADSPTVFSLNSGRLQMTEGAGAAVFLTNEDVEVTSIIFHNLSSTDAPGIVGISLNMQYINQTGREEYEYQTYVQSSVSLRP